jgi:hypothetical protein
VDVVAGKKFMQDLWRTSTSSWLNSRNNQILSTGDNLKGKNHCSIGDLADCLFTCWRSDPVHTATKVLI